MKRRKVVASLPLFAALGVASLMNMTVTTTMEAFAAPSTCNGQCQPDEQAVLPTMSFPVACRPSTTLDPDYIDGGDFDDFGDYLEQINTEDFQDTVFVLNAITLKSSHCADLDAVNSIASYFRNESRVKVLTMTLDGDALGAQAWCKKSQPNHDVVLDPKRIAWNALHQIGAVPQLFVTNCRHELTYYRVGSGNDQDDETIQAIKTALAESCAR